MATYESIGLPTSLTSLLPAQLINGTATTAIDTALVSHGITLGADAVATLQLSAPASTAWFHFNFGAAPGTGVGVQAQSVAIFNTANDVLFALRNVSGVTQNIEAYNTTANAFVVPIFGGPGLTGPLVYTIDIKVTPGSFEFYVDGTLIHSATGLTQPISDIDRCEFRNLNNTTSSSARVTISETIIGVGANSSTVGRRVRSRVPTANGALAAWTTGAFGNVDDGPAVNDSVFATSNTAGQRSSYTVPAWAGNSPIEAVRIQSSARHNSAGVQNYRHFSRISAVNYDHALLNPTATLASYNTVQTTSPATGLDWTTAEYNTLQIGILSA